MCALNGVGRRALTRIDVLNCYSESLTVGWPKCLMLAVMLEHFSIEHCKAFIRKDQKCQKNSE